MCRFRSGRLRDVTWGSRSWCFWSAWSSAAQTFLRSVWNATAAPPGSIAGSWQIRGLTRLDRQDSEPMAAAWPAQGLVQRPDHRHVPRRRLHHGLRSCCPTGPMPCPNPPDNKANGIKHCEPGHDVPSEKNTADRAPWPSCKTRPCPRPQQARAVGISLLLRNKVAPRPSNE
jgi:hypothetical protein